MNNSLETNKINIFISIPVKLHKFHSISLYINPVLSNLKINMKYFVGNIWEILLNSTKLSPHLTPTSSQKSTKRTECSIFRYVLLFWHDWRTYGSNNLYTWMPFVKAYFHIKIINSCRKIHNVCRSLQADVRTGKLNCKISFGTKRGPFVYHIILKVL